MKQIKTIEILTCDKCGVSSEEDSILVESYDCVDGSTIDLCRSCFYQTDTCYDCERIGEPDNDLFTSDFIRGGEYVCAECLKEYLEDMKADVSAAEIFMKRHGVE